MQVKKQTQQLRQFEEGLLSQYKFYLEDLEQTIKGGSPGPRTGTTWQQLTGCFALARLEAAEEEEALPGGQPAVLLQPGRGRCSLPL